MYPCGVRPVVEYTSVKLPKPIATQVRAALADDGFRSVSEFVIQAVREKLGRHKSGKAPQ